MRYCNKLLAIKSVRLILRKKLLVIRANIKP